MAGDGDDDELPSVDHAPLNEGGVGKTMNSVATTFATQPICNAAWAVHALRSTNNYGLCHAICASTLLKIMSNAR
jgi:hypothetical protein